MTPRDEPSIVCILPDGQARTRGLPYVEHFAVGASIGADPFEKVEDQRVDWVTHGTARFIAALTERYLRDDGALRAARGLRDRVRAGDCVGTEQAANAS